MHPSRWMASATIESIKISTPLSELRSRGGGLGLVQSFSTPWTGSALAETPSNWAARYVTKYKNLSRQWPFSLTKFNFWLTDAKK